MLNTKSNVIKNLITGMIVLLLPLSSFAYFAHIKAYDNTVFNVVNSEVARLGVNADLNHIDMSSVTNMEQLFFNDFNGDISNWDVSSVTNMREVFSNNSFNGDISRWDVGSVIETEYMFLNSKFNQDISNWNLSSLLSSNGMFLYSMISNQNKPQVIKK
jgi:hypothetical protein